VYIIDQVALPNADLAKIPETTLAQAKSLLTIAESRSSKAAPAPAPAATKPAAKAPAPAVKA
jgi:hypothetical protein